jgi:hypothetical protein
MFFLNHLPRALSSSGFSLKSAAVGALFTASALTIRNSMDMAGAWRVVVPGLHRRRYGSNMETDLQMDITTE